VTPRSERRRQRQLDHPNKVERVMHLLNNLHPPPEPEGEDERPDRLECGCAPWRNWHCPEHWRQLPMATKDALRATRRSS
jgi:hypothetical protein